MKEFNVTTSDCTPRDFELIFGPLSGHEELIIIDEEATWEQVWTLCGRFKSLSQARKQTNELGLISSGFHEHKTKKRWITVYIPLQQEEDEHV